MQSGQLKRREFTTLLGGAAKERSSVARAQQQAGRVSFIASAFRAEHGSDASTEGFQDGLAAARLCRGTERCERVPLAEESP
jgi:hypothetical protein